MLLALGCKRAIRDEFVAQMMSGSTVRAARRSTFFSVIFGSSLLSHKSPSRAVAHTRKGDAGRLMPPVMADSSRPALLPAVARVGTEN